MIQSSTSSSVICFFNTNKEWGGGEKWHFDMALNLYQKGYKAIICAYPDSILFQRAKEASLPVSCFKVSNFSFLNPFLKYKIKRFLTKTKTTHIVLNLPSDLKTAGIAAHKAGIKNIIYRRGSAKAIKNSFFNRYLFKHIINLVITNSKETKNTVLQNNKDLFPKDKIKVIYNGIQAEDYKNSIKPINPNKVVIGTAGRLSKEKGQSRFLDVCLSLKKRNLPVKVKIAGTGPEEEALKEKTKRLNLENYIDFVGFIEPFRNFLKDIDIFVLPSFYEGFGYVLIEAMAAKKPVVSFDIGAAREIVSHGENGYLIPDGRLAIMAKKIEILTENPELIKQFGNKGSKIAKEKFSDKKMYEDFIKTIGI